jgi:hypothetical protein
LKRLDFRGRERERETEGGRRGRERQREPEGGRKRQREGEGEIEGTQRTK